MFLSNEVYVVFFPPYFIFSKLIGSDNSGQVDTQLQICGSILQPNMSGKIKLSHGEAYLPHDKGSGAAPFNRYASNQSRHPAGYNRVVASKYVSRFLNLKPVVSGVPFHESSGQLDSKGTFFFWPHTILLEGSDGSL